MAFWDVCWTAGKYFRAICEKIDNCWISIMLLFADCEANLVDNLDPSFDILAK